MRACVCVCERDYILVQADYTWPRLTLYTWVHARNTSFDTVAEINSHARGTRRGARHLVSHHQLHSTSDRETGTESRL